MSHPRSAFGGLQAAPDRGRSPLRHKPQGLFESGLGPLERG